MGLVQLRNYKRQLLLMIRDLYKYYKKELKNAQFISLDKVSGNRTVTPSVFPVKLDGSLDKFRERMRHWQVQVLPPLTVGLHQLLKLKAEDFPYTEKALKKAGTTIDQVDLIEVQEAFAVQALADARLMGLQKADFDKKVNVNGSGISLGHPIGATGTMRMVTLIHEMKRRDSKYGLETICGGGGHGICAILKR